jgi:hypothetical protein
MVELCGNYGDGNPQPPEPE